MHRPLKCVRDFLTLRLVPGEKLLLALSGGGDSLALLYLLLECRKFLDFDLHTAHVDHAWREESDEEAKILRRLAQHLNLPFYLRQLEPLTGPNLEDRYRDKRYAFLHELQDKESFQAVLLAHHADDQGETLLKRICEGARLGALGGLKSEVNRGNLTLWRPLLPVRKAELIAYLQAKPIEPFDDWTNKDTHYLRPRMRLKIFPDLEEQFGKSIGRNFQRLGFLFQEMTEYLEEKKKEIEKELVQGPFGFYLENPSRYPRLVMRFFLEEVARVQEGHLSQDSCAALLRLIEVNAPKATIHAGALTYVLNKHYLFLLKKEFPCFDQHQWKKKKQRSNWKDFWRGTCMSVPDDCQILSLEDLNPILRKKMKKWYAKHQVPPFMHDKAPIFCSKGEIVEECLTGFGISDCKITT